MESKVWYLSKTIWVNLLAMAAIVIQFATGTAWLDAEIQGAILVIVNLILRIVTKQPLGK